MDNDNGVFPADIIRLQSCYIFFYNMAVSSYLLYNFNSWQCFLLSKDKVGCGK